MSALAVHLALGLPGGSTSYARRLVAAHDPARLRAELLLMPWGDAQARLSGPEPCTPDGVAAAVPWLVRRLRRSRAALLVTHAAPPGLAGRIAAALAGIPCLHVPHNWSGQSPGAAWRRGVHGVLDRCLAPLARAVVAPSCALLVDGRRAGWVRPGRGRALWYGIDLAATDARRHGSRAAARTALGLGLDDELLVFAGRFDPVKGLPVLVDAVRLLAPRRPRLRVELVGEGPERPAIAARAAGLPIGLPGWRSDGVAWLEAADLTVLPSVMENFPLVNLEAMAVGTPVVASAVGGIPEQLAGAGVCVPAGDAAALAAALEALLADPGRRAAMAAAGRRRVELLFSGDAWVRRFEQAELAAMGRRR